MRERRSAAEVRRLARDEAESFVRSELDFEPAWQAAAAALPAGWMLTGVEPSDDGWRATAALMVDGRRVDHRVGPVRATMAGALAALRVGR